MKKFLYLLLLALASVKSSYANDVNIVNPKLELVSIEAKATSEQVDEVYFDLVYYTSDSRAGQHRVPDFPGYWRSAQLDKVKNLELWQKDLENEEAVQLIISLVEKDAPPWNVDDNLGSVKLNLKNADGVLKVLWGKSNYVDNVKTKKQEDAETGIVTYELSSEKAKYILKFLVKA